MKDTLKLVVLLAALIAFGFGGTALTFRDDSAIDNKEVNSRFDTESGPRFSISQRSLCDKCHV